jgi:hypothetical protein
MKFKGKPVIAGSFKVYRHPKDAGSNFFEEEYDNPNNSGFHEQ